MGSLTDALALFARSVDLAKATKPSNETSQEPPKLEVTSGQLKTMSQHTQGLVSQYRGLVELKNISASQRADKSRWKSPIVERLDEYDDDLDLKNMVTYPPKLQPIPVKPLFFDLAWNYIEYPGRPHAAINGDVVDGAGSNNASDEKKDAKKGWFGFGR
jgi:signal recognition particle subunit SRP68